MEVELGPSATATGHPCQPGQGHHAYAAPAQFAAAPAVAFPGRDASAHDAYLHLDPPLTSERTMRKRKAESQDNERLSKRLSLLNIEQNGQKLYVPVESPQLKPTASKTLTQIPEGDAMELEDTKHKVYIYDLDAELDDGAESDDGRLVFLPDIEKHLAKNRIPSSVLAKNNDDGAGMQLVLYQEPASLSVPQEFDSVRKAIAETRARLRQKHQGDLPSQPMDTAPPSPPRIPNGLNNLANDVPTKTTAMGSIGNPWGTAAPEYDPDAMDVD